MSVLRNAALGYSVTKLENLYQLLPPPGASRAKITETLLHSWWPNHEIIWIDSCEDYVKIEHRLNALSAPALIMQTEEDWFMVLDWHMVRQQIKEHACWTDQCFVISNSRWDCDMMTAIGIRNQCKPGLIDLMTYRELPTIQWQRDLIRHHTSVMFGHMSWPADCDRITLCELLLKHKECVGIAGSIDAWNPCPDIADRCFIPESDCDAPDIPLDADYYLRTIAFSAVLETQYRGHWCPTTSEKTYRCFHNQVPALVCAGQNTRRYLLALGFDPCDWLFDWSWDREPDASARLAGFLQEIKRLLKQPLNEILDQIQRHRASLQHNQHNVRRLICNYKELDNIW